MSNFELFWAYQVFLAQFDAVFLQFQLQIFLKTLRNNGKATVFPVVPLEAIDIESVDFMEFALVNLLAFDGGVQSNVISRWAIENYRTSLVLSRGRSGFDRAVHCGASLCHFLLWAFDGVGCEIHDWNVLCSKE